MRIRRLVHCILAAAAGIAAVGSPLPAVAAEKVSVGIIRVSPWGTWYIMKEKNLAKGIDLDIQIIDDIPKRNAAIASGQLQCLNNTIDTIMLARAEGVPIKMIAFPTMSYGFDKMVVTKNIKSVRDFKGKKFGADYGFLNHMWMLLTLRREGMGLKDVKLVPNVAPDSAAAFVKGGIDIDVNYDPFAATSLTRKDAYIMKTSLTDRTWERGLIGDGTACNEKWLAEKPKVAKELLRAWFEATDWWKEHPLEGDEIIARGMELSVAEVKLNQYGAIQLTLSQNLGAFGLPGGKPLCASLPEGAPVAPKKVGWASCSTAATAFPAMPGRHGICSTRSMSRPA
jgi:NitT/TauT family transport system substrate-binding protein